MSSTDLEDRLTDLFARSAAAVEVRADVDAVIDDDVVVDLADRRRPRRVAFALAAAAILVIAAVAAVALASTGGDQPEGVTDAPDAPAERYPVLDVLPDDLAGRVLARGGPMPDGVTLHQLDMFATDGTPVVRAVVGRVADDGTVTEAMTIRAVPTELIAESIIPGAEPTTIAGRRAHVWVDDSTGSTAVVIEGDGASVLVHGPRPTAENLAGIEIPVLEADDDRAVLELGPMPDGLDVLLQPSPDESGEGVEVGAGEPGEPEITVSTGVGDPLAVMAEVSETFEPVDIGGSSGWMATFDEGEVMVSWRGPGGVALLAQGRLSPEDTLLVARGVRLVDDETWLEIYDGEPDGIPIDEATTAPSIPDSILGQPAPQIAGALTEVAAFTPPQAQGEWTILTISSMDCDRCDGLIDAVAEHAAEHPDGPGRPVSLVVGEIEEESVDRYDAYAAEHDITWPFLIVNDDQLREWNPQGTVPYLVIIDPDGVVTAVDSGPVDHAGLDGLLPEG